MPANLSMNSFTNNLTNRLTKNHASMTRQTRSSAPSPARPDTRGRSSLIRSSLSRSSNTQRAHAPEHPHTTARTAITNPQRVPNLNEADARTADARTADARTADARTADAHIADAYKADAHTPDTCKSANTPADITTGITANALNHAKQRQPDDRCTIPRTIPRTSPRTTRSNTSSRFACSLSSRIAASITALAERIATAAENHRALAERLITAGGVLLILIIYGLAALGD